MGWLPHPISSILLSKFSVSLSIFLAGLFSSLDAARAQPSPELLVAAAADLIALKEPLTESAQQFAGIRVRFTFGSSGLLARQIQNGAPYDVYLSANQEFVAALTRSGHLVAETARTYAEGRVGIWSKSGRIRGIGDLTKPDLKHVSIPNPVHAPYGVAAKAALTHRGLWDRIASRIVYAENVQQAFQFAQSGNADATITAWSLILDKGGVLIPAEWHRPIRQAGAVVSRSGQPAAALRFLAFLDSRRGRDILAKFGFLPGSRLERVRPAPVTQPR